MFYNSNKLKQDFTPLLKYYSITPICTSIKNLQSNALMECIYHIIYNMTVTKYLDRKKYYYIDPWGGGLALVVW